ncbi:MAG TPA: YCF48-related protein [Terriglobales bacterium]|nr:YCF48-related protein [Terriglobales bacterium]
MRTVLALFLLLLLVCGLTPAFCLDQDIQVEDIAFLDELHGWVSVGEPKPVLYHTSNGGTTWTQVSLNLALRCVHFLDSHTGIALHVESESTTAIYRTVDGGRSWRKMTSIELPNRTHLVDIGATSLANVFVVGEGSGGLGYFAQIQGKDATVQVRNDLPADFTRQSNALAVFGDGAQHVWIVGKELILHSANNGKTWENQYVNTSPRMDMAISGYALPGGHAWIAAADFDVYRTDDYGKHWDRTLTTTDHTNFSSISFSSLERGCAIGDSPWVYCTGDGGQTWSKTKAFPYYPEESATRSKIFLFPSANGWATINGGLYKTVDGGQSFREVLTATLPASSNIPGEFQALRTSINAPTELAYDDRGFLYIVESLQRRVLRLDLERASIKILAQPPDSDEDDDDIEHADPNAIATDQRGSVFIGDFNGRLRKLDVASGEITDLLPKETLAVPKSMATDASGTLLIADGHDAPFWWSPQLGLQPVRVRGAEQSSENRPQDPKASPRFSSGVAVDQKGDIFVADYTHCRIYRIYNETQILTTIAGTGVCNSYGDGGPAVAAALNYPSSIAVDNKGNLFFAEGGTGRVRRIDKSGIITTYAGTGVKGFSGDGGPATEAMLDNPSGLAIDPVGNLYIADFVNNRIRRVDAVSHIITTVAGNGKPRRLDRVM